MQISETMAIVETLAVQLQISTIPDPEAVEIDRKIYKGEQETSTLCILHTKHRIQHHETAEIKLGAIIARLGKIDKETRNLRAANDPLKLELDIVRSEVEG